MTDNDKAAERRRIMHKMCNLEGDMAAIASACATLRLRAFIDPETSVTIGSINTILGQVFETLDNHLNKLRDSYENIEAEADKVMEE